MHFDFRLQFSPPSTFLSPLSPSKVESPHAIFVPILYFTIQVNATPTFLSLLATLLFLWFHHLFVPILPKFQTLSIAKVSKFLSILTLLHVLVAIFHLNVLKYFHFPPFLSLFYLRDLLLFFIAFQSSSSYYFCQPIVFTLLQFSFRFPWSLQ
jgi:hypothetical protein